MLENKIMDLLSENNIPSPIYKVAKSPEEVRENAICLGFPMVMKILSPNIWHKTDMGGVKLGIINAEEAVAAYKMIQESALRNTPDAQLDGVILYPQVEDGPEIIIGVTQDISFGPVIMFGLGGIFVEVLKDVTFRALPITIQDAHEMINGIDNKMVLTGWRGLEKVDIPALANLLYKVSEMTMKHDSIEELDLNPVRYSNQRWLVLDAKIKLKSY